mgnify:CR=1 FL=1
MSGIGWPSHGKDELARIGACYTEVDQPTGCPMCILRAENERLREALRGAEAHHDEQARLWADNEGDGEADLNAQYHSERRDVFTAVLAEVERG